MMPSMAPLPPMPPQPFLPGGMGGAIPMHYPMQQKMPMVVMPYYSKSADKDQNKIKRKKRRPKKIHYDDSSSDYDDSGSASDEFNLRAKHKTKRRQVLTPVVSYVTKDGYVVYQKKIKKDKARDWLEMSKRAKESQEMDDREDDRESLLRKLKKLKFSKKYQRNRH